MHQAAGLGQHIRKPPQRSRAPHGQRGLSGQVRLKRNAARISRAHIVQQKVRVWVEGDVAERGDNSGESTCGIPESDARLRGETLDVAHTAADIFKYLLAGDRFIGWRLR